MSLRTLISVRWLHGLALLAIAPLALDGCSSITVPGQSYSGPLPPATADEVTVSTRLKRHVQLLAGDIGERNRARPEAYQHAQDYVLDAFRDAGYVPRLLQDRREGTGAVHNIEVELAGTSKPTQSLIIGAHYDSEAKCPGANDNASGIAALLELARLCAEHPMTHTVRFVAFYDEEDFGDRPMGSRLYASDCRKRGDNVIGMISLETIGFYTEASKSQHYPFLFHTFHPSYSRTGNFIAFIGNGHSRQLVTQTVTSFRTHTRFPSEAVIAPWYLGDAGRSDHSSFWKEGYPGLIVTDTADFRYDYYHEPGDTPEKLDYERMARVTLGLAQVIRDLAN